MKSKNSLSAETLGQISLIQSMVVHLPDKKKIFTFVAKGLKDLPGVGKVEFRMYEKNGDDDKKISEQKQELLYRFILKLKGYEHGELIISLTDAALFSPCIPFIENLANMLTVIFEERRQRALNDKIMDDLEKIIYLRTKELEIEVENHKQAEKEIKMLADSMKSISESVTITDLENRLTYVNQSFLKTYGYSEKELLGQNIMLVGSSKNSEAILDKIMAETWNGGWHGELWNTRKDGTEFLINLSTTVVYDKDSNPIGFIGISLDITARKLAEQEIISQKNNFEQLFINSPVAIAIMDQYDQILKINQAFTNLFEYTSEEATGHSLLDVVVPDGYKTEGELLSKIVHDGKPISQESYRRKKDGALVYVQIVGIPIVMEGKGIGIYTMYVDLTERKKAEEEIKKSETKYRTLFNNIADPVFIYDKKTHYFLDCNQAALDFYGYTIDEFRSMTPLQLHPPEEAERVLKNIDISEHDDHSYTHIKKNW